MFDYAYMIDFVWGKGVDSPQDNKEVVSPKVISYIAKNSNPDIRLHAKPPRKKGQTQSAN